MIRTRFLPLFLSLCLASCALGGCASAEGAQDTLILASMYPVYLAAANIADGVQGVRVESLAPAGAGCLHDYQMTTSDRQRVESADILVLNGLGAEDFLSGLLEGKQAIDASEGYETLLSGAHDHEEHDDHDEHDHGEINQHIWTSPDGAIWQAIKIRDGLCEADPKNAQAYVDNAQAYIDSLMELQSNMHASLKPYEGMKIAVLHDSLAYFAREFKLEIVSVLKSDPEAQLSARELTEAARAVREEGALAIFSELQYRDSAAAATLARETGLEVTELDSAVTGEEGNLLAYLEAMDYNTLAVAMALGDFE